MGTPFDDTKEVLDQFQGVFDDLFGKRGGKPSKDLLVQQEIPLIEAAHGAQRKITIERNDGAARAPKSFVLTIPPGVASGTTLRLAGEGNDLGDGRGDLLVTIEIAPHPTLTRRGDDLHARVRFDAARAAVGGTLKVPWLEGVARVPMPGGSHADDVLRLPGWGCVKLGATYTTPGASIDAPYRGAPATRGDLLVTLVDDSALAAAHRVLGLRPGASRADVEAAYRRLALAHQPERHPERADAPEVFARVHAAYAEITRVTTEPPPAVSGGRGVAIVAGALALATALAYLLLR